MARALFVLINPDVRRRVMDIIRGAPDGTRVEIKDAKRTLPQNARMWAMLTDVAEQSEHCGRKYDTDEWKVLFLHALGRETRFLPGLDGKTFVPTGQSSSDLSKDEMADLITFIEAWGAEHGIEFHEPPPCAERR